VNIHSGGDRRNRIEELLSKKKKYTLEDFKKMHSDVYSNKARNFMKILKPILINKRIKNDNVKTLLNWDLNYNKKNKKASALFDEFYYRLNLEVYTRVYTNETFDFMYQHTPFTDFSHYFDKILFEYKKRNNWIWKNETRNELFEKVFDQLKYTKKMENRKDSYFINSFFKDLVPPRIGALLNIHYGPFFLEGSRTTISQGQLFFNEFGTTSFGQSWVLFFFIMYKEDGY
jgi:hypothetical protein